MSINFTNPQTSFHDDTHYQQVEIVALFWHRNRNIKSQCYNNLNNSAHLSYQIFWWKILVWQSWRAATRNPVEALRYE